MVLRLCLLVLQANLSLAGTIYFQGEKNKKGIHFEMYLSKRGKKYIKLDRGGGSEKHRDKKAY